MKNTNSQETKSLVMVDFADRDPRSFKAWLKGTGDGNGHENYDRYLDRLARSGSDLTIDSVYNDYFLSRQNLPPRTAKVRPERKSFIKVRVGTVLGAAIGLVGAAAISSWVL